MFRVLGIYNFAVSLKRNLSSSIASEKTLMKVSPIEMDPTRWAEINFVKFCIYFVTTPDMIKVANM